MSHTPMPHTKDRSPAESPLSPTLAFSYAAPVLPMMFLFGPIAVLQGIYAKYFGLSLTDIAAVLIIARIFDAVTDPLIGYTVDRYCANGGSRKRFLASGFLLLMIASWFLYVPVGTVSVGYFLGWYLMLYLAFTLFDIPHLAWVNKLTVSTQNKSTLYTLRAVASSVGGLLFFVVPQLPFFTTSQITPETLKWTVGLAYLLMLPALYACLANVPNEYGDNEYRDGDNRGNPEPKKPVKKDTARLLFSSLVNNNPLMMLLVACAFMFFAGGMGGMILFLFVDVYLEMGDKFALISMLSFGSSLVFLKLWHHLSHYWTMKILWLTGVAVMAVGSVGTGLLSPGDHWQALLFWSALTMGGGSVFAIAIPALISNIADFGTWKFGTDRTATYFSLYTFLNKTVSAVGGALGLAIAGWYGFDPSATQFSESAAFGLRLSIVWVPILILSLGAALVLGIPISERQHKVIRKRLDLRQRRVSAVVS